MPALALSTRAILTRPNASLQAELAALGAVLQQPSTRGVGDGENPAYEESVSIDILGSVPDDDGDVVESGSMQRFDATPPHCQASEVPTPRLPRSQAVASLPAAPQPLHPAGALTDAAAWGVAAPPTAAAALPAAGQLGAARSSAAATGRPARRRHTYDHRAWREDEIAVYRVALLHNTTPPNGRNKSGYDFAEILRRILDGEYPELRHRFPEVQDDNGRKANKVLKKMYDRMVAAGTI